jgi:hypothetical protein
MWNYRAGVATLEDLRVSGFPMLRFACDQVRKTIGISSITGSVGIGSQISITTTFGTKVMPIPRAIGPHGEFSVELDAKDPFFDELAYTRGRFLVTLPSDVRLILPAAPEIARAIEDCRG